MSNLVNVDDGNFESEVINSKVPVLVDFGASWCAPCQRQHPIVEKFANENADKIKVCQIDVDDSPAVAKTFGIRSVPSLILFNNGAKVDTKVGLVSLADLTTFVFSKIII